jgi:putative transposase
LEIGGVADHCHAFLSLPANLDVSKAVQLIKGGSSKWMNQNNYKRFEWQEGFASFSVGVSQTESTCLYIKDQERHHRRISFTQEFIAFLKRHNIPYEKRYLLG